MDIDFTSESGTLPTVQENNTKVVLRAEELAFGRGTPQSPSIFEKCFQMPDHLKITADSVFHREIESKTGVHITFRNRELLSFGYCDYLGLSQNQQIKNALISSISEEDLNMSSSRAIAGTSKKHIELEKNLAELVGGEDCILFPLGYMANIGVIPAIAKKNEVILVDSKSHASLIDACRLAQIAGTEVIPFKHNDMGDLEKKLAHRVSKPGRLIVTDAVFSMDGNIANLKQIDQLAKHYNAGVMIDDAHGIGLLGTQGGGTPDHLNLKGAFDLVMGTLSKSFPLLGGYIVGKKEVVNYLKSSSRSYLFCLGLPDYIVNAALVTLEIIKSSRLLRENVMNHAVYLKKSLQELGFEVSNSETPIISIITRDYDRTFKLVRRLENLGIFVDPIIYPGVKKSESRLRIVLTSSHTRENIDFLLRGLSLAGREYSFIV